MRLRWLLSGPASLGLLLFPLGESLWAAPRAKAPKVRAEAETVRDVALGEGGTLIGYVVNSQGAGVHGAKVVVQRDAVVRAQAVTNESGAFAVHGLSGGVHEITGANGAGTFRLWTPGAAPPQASNSALISASPLILRGRPRGIRDFLTSDAVVLTTIIAAAIAIPIAVHNTRNERRSGS